MGPPTDIRHPGSDGGPPGELWLNVAVFIPLPRSIVHCSNSLLFQHLTNTVCRPTMHTHTHSVSEFSLFFFLSLSPLHIRKFLLSQSVKRNTQQGVKAAKFQMYTPLMLLSHLFLGTSRCQWCWWVTRWTWRRKGRCPPARARRWPRTGAAPSWRRRPRARPWWMSFSLRSSGRWTSAPCPTGERPAAPPAVFSSSQSACRRGDGWEDARN